MKKADRERLFALVDEMREIIYSYKILNKQDVYTLVNELITLKLAVRALEKGVSWEEKENDK